MVRERGIKEIHRYDRGQGREKEDPREKEVDADGSSSLILVQEAQRWAEQVLLHHRGRGSLEATRRMAQCRLLFLFLLNAGSPWALSSSWLMSLLCKAGNAWWCTELSRLQTQESRKKWDEGQGKQPKGNAGRWKGRLRSSWGQAHVVIFFFCTLLYCSMSMTQ